MRYLVVLGLSVLVLAGAGCFTDSSSRLPEATGRTQAEPAAETSSSGAAFQAVPIDGTSEVDAAAEAKEAASTSVLEGAADPGLDVTLAAGNFFFDGDTITAKPGQEITVIFSHVDGGHTFVIDDADVREAISANGTVTFTAPTTPGEYPYYCDVSGHRRLGMEGKLIVAE